MSTTDPRRFLFYLTALRELGAALASESRQAASDRPLRESLYRIMGTFAVGRGALLLRDESDGRLALVASKGVRAAHSLELTPPEPLARALAASAHPFHVALPAAGREPLAALLEAPMRKARLGWIAPLATGTSLAGLLLLGERVSGEPFTQLELEILEEMAAMLALRLEDVRARRRLAAQVRQLRQVNRELRRIYLETVRALAGVIDGPEPGAAANTHSVRVAALAAEIARRLGLSAERRRRLYLAGLLHDLGKHLIERDLLGKPAPLSPDERRRVESHAAAGFELISHLRFPWGDVAEIIRHHHERLDGTGYPDCLRGDQISLEARILMTVEAFDAMTSDQPWRPHLAFEQVVRQIQENLGLQFEPAIAHALCEAVEAGLDGQAAEPDFVTHLATSFDPALIRSLLGELRNQLRNPTIRQPARIVEIRDAS